jgi:hypothetical protein
MTAWRWFELEMSEAVDSPDQVAASPSKLVWRIRVGIYRIAKPIRRSFDRFGSEL